MLGKPPLRIDVPLDRRELASHFALTDRGELVVQGLGEGTTEEIFEGVYPVLDRALSDA